MEYKIQDTILCNRQDSFGFVQGTIVKVFDDNPNYDYIVRITAFSGSPVEDEYMWINKDNIIKMQNIHQQIRTDVNIGDRVQTLKGTGVVSVVDTVITVNLDGNHGCYCFPKDLVWKVCRCDTCLLKNLDRIVPSQCEWYRDNVTFGDKSADECPYYKPIKNNT